MYQVVCQRHTHAGRDRKMQAETTRMPFSLPHSHAFVESSASAGHMCAPWCALARVGAAAAAAADLQRLQQRHQRRRLLLRRRRRRASSGRSIHGREPRVCYVLLPLLFPFFLFLSISQSLFCSRRGCCSPTAARTDLTTAERTGSRRRRRTNNDLACWRLQHCSSRCRCCCCCCRCRRRRRRCCCCRRCCRRRLKQ